MLLPLLVAVDSALVLALASSVQIAAPCLLVVPVLLAAVPR